jgi:hypothetical protein
MAYRLTSYKADRRLTRDAVIAERLSRARRPAIFGAFGRVASSRYAISGLVSGCVGK